MKKKPQIVDTAMKTMHSIEQDNGMDPKLLKVPCLKIY